MGRLQFDPLRTTAVGSRSEVRHELAGGSKDYSSSVGELAFSNQQRRRPIVEGRVPPLKPHLCDRGTVQFRDHPSGAIRNAQPLDVDIAGATVCVVDPLANDPGITDLRKVGNQSHAEQLT